MILIFVIGILVGVFIGAAGENSDMKRNLRRDGYLQLNRNERFVGEVLRRSDEYGKSEK